MSDWNSNPKYNPWGGPVKFIHGRPCQIGKAVRVVSAKKQWGYHNIASIRYLDDAEPQIETMPLGKINKIAKMKSLSVGHLPSWPRVDSGAFVSYLVLYPRPR